MEDEIWNKWNPVFFDATITFHVCSECLECHWINLVRIDQGVCEKCEGETKTQLFGGFYSYWEYRVNLAQWSIGKTVEEIAEAKEKQKMTIQMETL